MSRINLEPMIALFINEGFQLVSDLESIMEGKGEDNAVITYGTDDLFRIWSDLHTMKASAAMVLFDGLADAGRSMEKLVQFFRQERLEDMSFLHEMLSIAVAFFHAEIEKVAGGEIPDGVCNEINDRVYEFLTAKEHGLEAWQREEQMRQLFYIPGCIEDK